MPKINHLHPSMTEHPSSYRPCEVHIIAQQIAVPDPAPELWKPIMAVDDEGGYTPVGLLLMFNRQTGIRVLYNWLDLYDVQAITMDDEDYQVTAEYTMVDAFTLSQVVQAIAARRN